ncbi:hypothetical protein [Prosthecobacter dejongeii]|uniref:Uncharacterized protein n=1 Tax=Prosthecobacter dejongeii TaxID=48465 RepID=A0A7W7YIZ0_9BACT|nr:hypothetical protein [Prosthecobacter dejongeii]MBB5036937.1 hypothetical protein [Prosthecobacter dejongeii]
MTCGSCLCATIPGCSISSKVESRQLQRHLKSELIEKVRIVLSGLPGSNRVTPVYDVQNLPPATDEEGNLWVMVVEGMAGYYLTYHNMAVRTEYSLKSRSSSPSSKADDRRLLPTRQAWKQWYAAVSQDSLLRLKDYGYTAKVEFLNARGQPLETITTETAKPQPILESARTPPQYFEKTGDVIHARSPWPG